jgi:hypothetical protein
MNNNFNTNEIFNGSNGAIWLSTDNQLVKVGSMKSFSLKQKNIYADVDEAESLTKKRRLVGVELTGELTKWKVDDTFIKIFSQYKDDGQMDISFVGKAYNNSTGKVQRVKVTGVTLDELNLLDLQPKTAVEENMPYQAEDYKWLELE